MTIPEILNALEGLRELTNDNGKAIIDGVKPAIRRLIDPDRVVEVAEAIEARLVHVEKEREVVTPPPPPPEPLHKTTKKKK